ncbi:carbohydrate ABC transporter ATP-binding protein (CUT1 family) [Stella humosa]|uniref:Carbohydrate ABC transporter ATP-binding protein (CUT1 family) n=1 Tax=Stella humosa TaxID=94 RepID=A0A3N1M813_9PROT|nr:ABC transporter ATP-binding protein [Stella humosa]ROP99810.1 carbohydrate ABC transporter ATP-binding protein (CUT1 family) [Stella humosa]BBK30962.1 ABC transporter ATP-binding protein [Stella humosa]
MAAIVLTNVSKDWGETRVLDDVSFAADEGSLVVLLGPSGCGKSTTLRLIAGLDQVSSGTITIAGRDVTALKPGQRSVAMVFQSYALFPHLTVRENIVFGLKARKVPAADRERRLARAADVLGLAALLERKPSQLSGGQQQRVALGRAIVAESPVCLMDEPLSNLDAQLRGDMRREIRALQQRLGMTMVYVTHDQVEAMTMADRVILMERGRIAQNGPPEELYARPRTVFAARFIGTPPMNVVDAARLSIPSPRPGALLGVRPENVAVAAEGLPARVVTVEYLGADSLVETEAAGEKIFAKVEGKSALKPGDTVHLAWVDGDCHWFDAKTGERLQ